MSNQQLEFPEQALPEQALSCDHGHDWQPTIILGYFQCAQCNKLAACKACVLKVHGKSMIGYCRAHQHLRTADTEQEVLG